MKTNKVKNLYKKKNYAIIRNGYTLPKVYGCLADAEIDIHFIRRCSILNDRAFVITEL